MERQNYSDQAAKQEGRTASGDTSRTRMAISALTDMELDQAHTWERFAEDWKQRMLRDEIKRRGSG